jgi:hypothetical protein
LRINSVPSDSELEDPSGDGEADEDPSELEQKEEVSSELEDKAELESEPVEMDIGASDSSESKAPDG